MEKQKNYKFSRQFVEVLRKLDEFLVEQNKKVIESQDLLLAMLSVQDTGSAAKLGKETVTRSRVLNEINTATVGRVAKKDDKKDIDVWDSYSETRRRENKIKREPIKFMKEKATKYTLEYSNAVLSEQTLELLEFAEELRVQANAFGKIDTIYVLIGMLQKNNCNAYLIIEKILLLSKGERIEHLLYPSTYMYNDRYRDGYLQSIVDEEIVKKNKIDNRLNDPEFSLLEEVSIDITKRAQEGKLPEVVGREKEIKKIDMTLVRMNKNNVVLLGNPGVGKTAIIEGLATKIAKGENRVLANKKILAIDLSKMFSLLADTSKIVNKFIAEMEKEKNVILYIDEIHLLGRYKSFTDKLKPLMARGDFRIVGATTKVEWLYHIESDKALVRRFEKILVEEPTEEEALEILLQSKNIYENYHKTTYTKEALRAAISLSKKYLTTMSLPDSAFTILDNAAAIANIENNSVPEVSNEYMEKLNKLREQLQVEQQKEYNEEKVEELHKKISNLVEEYSVGRYDYTNNEYPLKIEEKHIKLAIEEKTGIPLKDIFNNDKLNRKEELEKLKKLKIKLNEKVIGQETATDTLYKSVLRSKLGFRDKNKPIGSYLFIGTTGVGKTEVVKVLAEEMFGDRDKIIRFDMSEFQTEYTVSRLVGSPPGYVGNQKGGELTNKVLENPYSIILFDEIEKAHPKIYDILLQLLDEGRLTDGKGETVNFKDTIIVMTSNLGAKDIPKISTIGNKDGEEKERYLEAVKKYFRPEMLNRIDDIVIFNKLAIKDVEKITKILLDKQKGNMKEQGLDVQFDKSVVKYIAKLGYDENFGARPIKRVITSEIENLVSEALIEEEITMEDSIKIKVVGKSLGIIRV